MTCLFHCNFEIHLAAPEKGPLPWLTLHKEVESKHVGPLFCGPKICGMLWNQTGPLLCDFGT